MQSTLLVRARTLLQMSLPKQAASELGDFMPGKPHERLRAASCRLVVPPLGLDIEILDGTRSRARRQG